MAIYHAHIKSFSRGKGESSLAAAAYRAGLDLLDTRTHDWHRYAKRRGVAAVRMLAPVGSPPWCSDPKVFWDANEAWETRKNARVARELEVSLPHELDSQQREALAVALGQMLVDRYGCVVMVAIHDPVGGSDDRNHHTHLLMSARKIGPDGIGERAGAAFDARGGKGAEELRVVRKIVGQTINAHLTRAGLDQSVDHRSLKDQATAATERGDHQAAIRLTRPPTRHQGKVATHAARDEASAPGAQMDQAIAEAAARGALAATPAAHSHDAAFADRVQARRTTPPTKTAPAWGRAVRPSKAGQPSGVALRLSRLGRIARSQGGAGADVLNAEAALIEQWLDAMAASAEAALEAAQQIPGVRLEPEFIDAIGSLRVRRVAVYGTKPDLFEDTEALSWAIQNYATELCRPYENRQRLWKARARLSELENPAEPGTNTEILRGRREVWKSKRGVSRPAMIECERRLNQARHLMVQARNELEKKFYITPMGPLESDPLGESSPPATGGGTKGSDSNQQQLKPKPGMRPGH